MKKVMTLLLVVVMLIGCMTVTAFAAKAGETVEVTFSTNDNPGFISYNANLSYDSSALKVVSITEGALTSGKGMFSDGAKPSFMAGSEVTGNGVLFKVTFEILEGAEEGKTYAVSASIENGSALNGAYETVDFKVSANKSIEIDGHEHVWGEWEVTKEASCTEKGEKTRTCAACGEVETKEIPLAEHSWSDWEVTKKATCKAKGEKTRSCEVCGETETKSIKKADHKYKDGKCIWCNKVKGGYDNVPSTGDITPVVTMGVVAMISVVAAAAYVTKRRITK